MPIELSKKNSKHFIAIALFASIQIVLLINNFSIAGAANTVLVLLYLFVKNAIKRSDASLTGCIGNYIAAGILNAMLINFFGLFDSFISFLNDSEGAYGEKLAMYYESLDIGRIVLLLCPVMACCLMALDKVNRNKVHFKSLSRLFAHLLLNVYFLIMLVSIISETAYDSTYFIIVSSNFFLFVILEIFVNYIIKSNDNSLVISDLLTGCSFLLICSIDRAKGISMMECMMKIGNFHTTEWYVLAILAFVFVLAAIACYYFDNATTSSVETGTAKLSDCGLILLIGFDVLSWLLAIKSYTKYTVLFAIPLIILNAVVVLYPGVNEEKDSFLFNITLLFGEKSIAENSRLLVEVFFFIVFATMYAGHIHGCVDTVAMWWVVVGLFMIFYKSRLVTQILIVALGLFSCDLAYHLANSPKIFTRIIFVTILLSLFVYVLGISNKKIKDSSEIYRYVIVILGMVLLITVATHPRTRIKDSIEFGEKSKGELVSDLSGAPKNIRIEFKPIDKDNSITYCAYYWISDKDNLHEANVSDGYFITQNEGFDTLVVVCMDENGVVTKYSRAYGVN